MLSNSELKLKLLKKSVCTYTHVQSFMVEHLVRVGLKLETVLTVFQVSCCIFLPHVFIFILLKSCLKFDILLVAL